MQSITTKEKVKPPQKLCLCKAISPILTLCKLVGLFPITTEHKNGNCHFKKSNFWLCVSLIRIIQLCVQLVFSTDIFNIFNIGKGKSIHELISSINDVLYALYVTVLTFLNVIRYPRFIVALNHLTPIIQEGLLCQSALKTIRKIQKAFVTIIVFVFLIQYAAIIWLHFSDSFQTYFNINTLVNRFSQNMTFIFYVMFSTMCHLFIGILGCFEKLTINTLKYSSIHPLKGFDETNMQQSFMGIFTYLICDEVHYYVGKIERFSSGEVIEYLRSLHEDISLVMYEINDCLNPQLLCHTVVELTVLIVQWYAVIIYIAYNFSTPVVSPIHFLNCLFVILHTLGLFIFLKNAQQQHNMVHGITHILLEYSTRISLPEEYQQIRLFIEKLKLHRPVTANGIFTIDLAISGPICANILTYVLVALQFDVPKT